MSKCALPAKREGHQNGTILQTQEGSYEAETAGGFFLRFCLPFLSRHLPPPRYRRKERKSAGIASAQIRKKKLCKKPLGRYGREIVQGEASSRPVCRSQSAAPVMQGRHITDPLPGGSQDIGGAFRSRVQRPGVRHRSMGAGRIRPMWLRTDLVQVKRDRHTGRP